MQRIKLGDSSKAFLINNKNFLKEIKAISCDDNNSSSKEAWGQEQNKISKEFSFKSNFGNDNHRFISRNLLIDERESKIKTVFNRDLFINESVFDNKRKLKYLKLREEIFGKKKTKWKRRRSWK